MGRIADGGNAMLDVFRDVRLALGEMIGGGKLEPEQELSVEVLFGLLGVLARADGVVSTEEAAFTNTLMDELSLSTRARQLATEAFDRGCRRQIDAKQEIARFIATYPVGSSQIDDLYRSLLRLAAADDRIRPGERVFLETVTSALGFPVAALDVHLKKFMQ